MHPRAELSLSLLLVSLAITQAGRIGPATWGYTDAAEADRVYDLPGWGAVRGFGLFSGYITVNEEAGRHTFYIFSEAEHNPRGAPVILWLNGGPGCSSVGGGFMSELGPWFPTPEGQLERNPHSWNHFANVLFIESPHGVGFSYSEREEDLVTGDARTAADSYEFLLRFYERFPQFADNDLFLAGESYAGHYVPQLAWEIVKANRGSGAGSSRRGVRAGLPLVGFLLGNPLTVPAVDSLGAVDFWWSHALISDESAAGIKAYCNFSDVGPLREGEAARQGALRGHHAGGRDGPAARMCDDFVQRSQDEMGDINIYEIYADVCHETKHAGQVRRLADVLEGHPAGFAARVAVAAMDRVRDAHMSSRTAAASRYGEVDVAQRNGGGGTQEGLGGTARATRATMRYGVVHVSDTPLENDDYVPGPPYDPCVDDEVQWYLNRPEVQRALHANQSESARKHLPGKWKDCSNRVKYSREDLLQPVLPVYRHLLEAKLNMLVYSGDVDGIVPVIGTRRWVAGLGLGVREPWRPWTDERSQVGGYIVVYDGISFATVRNAGHMVPYTQPERMYHLAKMYLSKVIPPS